jgi:hypothetical protein
VSSNVMGGAAWAVREEYAAASKVTTIMHESAGSVVDGGTVYFCVGSEMAGGAAVPTHPHINPLMGPTWSLATGERLLISVSLAIQSLRWGRFAVALCFF